jgi:hypothetical protein
MAAKKGERRSGLTGQPSIVQKLVGQAQERQEAERTDGRGRAGHGGERGQDKRGYDKATYYVSLARQDLVREMAEVEDVSQSDIVEAAIVALYNAWKAETVDLEPLKKPTRSLKAGSALVVPEDFDIS